MDLDFPLSTLLERNMFVTSGAEWVGCSAWFYGIKPVAKDAWTRRATEFLIFPPSQCFEIVSDRSGISPTEEPLSQKTRSR